MLTMSSAHSGQGWSWLRPLFPPSPHPQILSPALGATAPTATYEYTKPPHPEPTLSLPHAQHCPAQKCLPLAHQGKPLGSRQSEAQGVKPGKGCCS